MALRESETAISSLDAILLHLKVTHMIIDDPITTRPVVT
jgi:hypothetical protein